MPLQTTSLPSSRTGLRRRRVDRLRVASVRAPRSREWPVVSAIVSILWARCEDASAARAAAELVLSRWMLQSWSRWRFPRRPRLPAPCPSASFLSQSQVAKPLSLTFFSQDKLASVLQAASNTRGRRPYTLYTYHKSVTDPRHSPSSEATTASTSPSPSSAHDRNGARYKDPAVVRWP